MMLRRRPEHEPKITPARVMDPFGRWVAPVAAEERPAAPMRAKKLSTLSPRAPKPAAAPNPRPFIAAPKPARDMPGAGDRARLWAHVASLECQRCGATGVQVSHSNALIDGKGRSMKSHDFRIAALCPACHHEIDQGSHLSRQERREQWVDAHHKTVGELFIRGLIRPV